MKKRIFSMALAFALMLTLLPTYAEVRDNPFTDVKTSAWYYDDVMYVYEEGLMTGTSETLFSPNMNLTRGMLVTVLYRMQNAVPAIAYSNPFTDVKDSAWYADAVKWAAANGIVTGMSEGTFAPNANITREQLAAILYRYAVFTDNGPTGKPGVLFDPKGEATRAEAAAMLHRFLEQTAGEQSGFAEIVYEFFLEVSKIPRESKNEKAISDYLAAFGKERNLETVQDKAFNVLIKKPGSEGRENEPPVVLQAHMDMVCEKNQDVDHDFLKDAIIPVITSDLVTAQKKTTLGADNGVGVAMILAVLDSDTLSHPPIEAIITTDEEAGMSGAAAFDISLLNGKRFINLDNEEEGKFAASCAAGTDVDIVLPIEIVNIPEGLTTYKLMIKGLTGGHSGVEIHKGLANANLLLAGLFHEFTDTKLYASSIDGGSKRNAIPRECVAVISFADEDLKTVQAAVGEAEKAYKSEYPLDTGLSITLEKTDTVKSVMSEDSLKRVLDGILGAPNGVLAMSPDMEGLVQTSNNLGVVASGNNTVTLSCFPRSSVKSEQEETIHTLKALADSISAKALIENPSPAWSYNPVSPLRDKMAAVFKDMYAKEPLIIAVHAGLECGWFAAKMPDADLVSIGPDMWSVHSPDERMSISSFNRTCDFFVKILEEI